MVGQGDRQISRQLFEQFASIGKALGNARRLEIINLLAQSEYTVEKLAMETGMSIANTSQHLQTLKAARLVDVRRVGVVAHYRLSGEDVCRTWLTLRDLGAANLADVDRLGRQLWRDRDPDTLVTPAELLAVLNDGSMVVVDIRPDPEYCAGHIKGAISIPLEELPKRFGELDPERDVVLYGRGPYDIQVKQAAVMLQYAGFYPRQLDRGLPEWRSQGLPLEMTSKEAYSAS